MNLEDTTLLQRWATLQLAIAAAKTGKQLAGAEPRPLDGEVVTPDTLFQSRGYKALRGWFLALSPGAKKRARTWMTTQLDGVAKLKAKLEAEGSAFDYADLDELELDVQDNDDDEEGPTT